MAIAKGWAIKSKEPNNIFWSLEPTVENNQTINPAKALWFARKIDADTYLREYFHPNAQPNYCVIGVH